MQRTDCHIGIQVIFGRAQGEKTLGEVVKMNLKKAKVKILEDRGQKGSEGSTWGVPYELMRKATLQEENVPGKFVDPAVLELKNRLMETGAKVSLREENISITDCHILQAIACCYADLSPENLTCDGEVPPSQEVELNRKLRGLFQAYGREVGEFEIHEWSKIQQGHAFTAKKMLGHC